MKNFKAHAIRVVSFVVVLAVLFGAFVARPELSQANADAATIVVTNSSSRTMRFIYLSPVATEDWSADQLQNGQLIPGQSVTVGIAACAESEIKVIGEDTDGCFVSEVISCGGNENWEITNDYVPNCGN